MKYTHTLIVGASVAGLASAAALQKKDIAYILIEKEMQAATPWRKHYDRLHLHTNKGLSNLPYKKFDHAVPRYPSRQQVVDYLDEYQKEFNIRPLFNTEARSIKKEGEYWITQTANEIFSSTYIILATGAYSRARPIIFNGMETFPGKILHSSEYKTGKDFNQKKVLVVGFGNSACEIAIDLYEQGAAPALSVRSPVNIVPRDLLGIPIMRLSQLMSRLPPRVADAINNPLMRLVVGNITKLGLKKMPYGIFEQIKKDGTVPLLDIGTLKHIRKGHIKMYGAIERIDGRIIHFKEGQKGEFDAVIAAIGYDKEAGKIIDIDQSRFADLNVCADQQKYFGKEGLYFCGFWVGPRGMFREIALDAKKIAADIAKRKNSAAT